MASVTGLKSFTWPAPSIAEGPAPSNVEGPAPSSVDGPVVTNPARLRCFAATSRLAEGLPKAARRITMTAAKTRTRLFMRHLLATAVAILVWASLLAAASASAKATARLRQGSGEASPKLEERWRARPRQSSKSDGGDVDLWTFDRLDRIGGHKTTVLGDPRLVDTPVGKAIEFDGVDDAI